MIGGASNIFLTNKNIFKSENAIIRLRTAVAEISLEFQFILPLLSQWWNQMGFPGETFSVSLPPPPQVLWSHCMSVSTRGLWSLDGSTVLWKLLINLPSVCPQLCCLKYFPPLSFPLCLYLSLFYALLLFFPCGQTPTPEGTCTKWPTF